MLRFIPIFFLCLFSQCITGQDVTGTWKTIDDETGNPKSYVEITVSPDGQLTGTITNLLEKPQNTLCQKCSGDLKNKPIVGMMIIKDMRIKDGYYQGGTILDPNNGKTYKCKLWLQNGNVDILELRGSVGPFFRTQKWFRVK
jgi:uncharacterized protein (DUF2147 family)